MHPYNILAAVDISRVADTFARNQLSNVVVVGREVDLLEKMRRSTKTFYIITKVGGNSTKYSITIPSRIPLSTSPLPFPEFASVNQRMAPASTTMNAYICPMKMRKSQISAR
ncbi:MAG: hypothetical protein ACFFCT_13890 [Candidatus Odinarchaeota archaeon]